MSTDTPLQPDAPAAVPKQPAPTPASSGVEVQGVSKSYRRGQRVLSDVSLHIRAGETFGIIGPNGAGKTTLFGCMLGLPSFALVGPDGKEQRLTRGYSGYTMTLKFLRIPTPSGRRPAPVR